MFDPDTNASRLQAHRQLHSSGLRPWVSEVEDNFKEAIKHLNTVLNGCQNHDEQIRADTAARQFLRKHL